MNELQLLAHSYCSLDLVSKYATARALLLEKQGRPHSKKPTQNVVLPATLWDLEPILCSNNAFRRNFFSPGDMFDQLRSVWPKANDERKEIGALLESCKQHMSEFDRYGATLGKDSLFQASFLKALNQAHTTLDSIPQKLKELGLKSKSSCFDFTMTMIRVKQNFLSDTPVDYNPIDKLDNSLRFLQNLMNVSTICESHDNVVVLDFESAADFLYKNLCILEPVVPFYEERLSLRRLVDPDFYQAQLSTILGHLFMRNVPIKGTTCSLCGNTSNSRGIPSNHDSHELFCTYPCFALASTLEKGKQQCPSLALLEQQDPLTRHDRTLLARAASLIYYFKLLLPADTSPDNDQGELFKLNLQTIIGQLEHIITLSSMNESDEHTQLWRDALHFVSFFSLDCKKLVTVLKLVLHFKN